MPLIESAENTWVHPNAQFAATMKKRNRDAADRFTFLSSYAFAVIQSDTEMGQKPFQSSSFEPVGQGFMF